MMSRKPSRFWKMLVGNMMKQKDFAKKAMKNWNLKFVITSYSIHYTKLYEAIVRSLVVGLIKKRLTKILSKGNKRKFYWAN